LKPVFVDYKKKPVTFNWISYINPKRKKTSPRISTN